MQKLKMANRLVKILFREVKDIFIEILERNLYTMACISIIKRL
jgi:hypothetical protein